MYDYMKHLPAFPSTAKPFANIFIQGINRSLATDEN